MSQPRYRVLEKSFIDGVLLEAGDEMNYLGEPGSQLEPLNDAAKIAKYGTVHHVDDASDASTPMEINSAKKTPRKG